MKLLTLLSAAALIALSLAAVSSAAEGYPAPDVSKAQVVLQESQFISDRTPPTRIDITTYKGKEGLLTRTYGVSGAVFRYDVDTNGGQPYEYRLLDNDGDGVFETKETLVGEMVVRDKGQKYYIDLGPGEGEEARYSYEDAERPDMPEQKQLLMGYPIYVPQWVLLRFK